MREALACTTAVIALSILAGATSAQQNPLPRILAWETQQQTQQTQQTQIVSPQQQGESKDAQQKQQQRGAEDAVKSESGKAGAQEPSVAVPQAQPDQSVLVNGALNTPGAPKDSQTVPSKFSQHNAALDKFSIVAQPLGFSEAQRKTILESVRASNAPIAKLDAKATEVLPSTVELFDFSPTVKSEFPTMTDVKFVRLQDKVLLVYSPNWIVIGEIKN